MTMNREEFLAEEENFDFSHIQASSLDDFLTAAQEEQPDINDNVDYYTILNVPRNASTDDIKSAYKRLSMIYHPDKLSSSIPSSSSQALDKDYAAQRFSQINSAYESINPLPLLSNEQTRSIYDVSGLDGLQDLMQVGQPLKTPAEIRAEITRIKYKNKKNQIENVLKQSTADMELTLDVSASLDGHDGDLFEVDQLRLIQSTNMNIANLGNLNIGGVIVSKNLKGGGYLVSTLTNYLNAKTTLESSLAVGTQSSLSSKITYRHSSYSTFECDITQDRLPWDSPPTCRVGVTRMIGPNTFASLSYASGHFSIFNLGHYENDDGLELSLRKASRINSLRSSIHLGLGSQGLRNKFTHRLDAKTSLLLSSNISTSDGLEASVGSSVNIIPNYRYNTQVSLNSSGMVVLKTGITRLTSTLTIPLILSWEFDWKALLLASSITILTTFGARKLSKYLVSKPRKISTRAQDEALKDLEIMTSHYKRKAEQEQAKNGLLIIEAIYGNFDTATKKPVEGETIDVKIPVQMLVVDSKLVIIGKKSNQLGFWDPCPGKDKMFMIKYRYRNQLHEALYNDEEQVVAPLKAHRQ